MDGAGCSDVDVTPNSSVARERFRAAQPILFVVEMAWERDAARFHAILTTMLHLG
jgi:hypothetical protein